MDNIHTFSDRNSIETEAREWLIRLDSETPPGDEEVEALREWLNRSPAHRRELQRISKFWDSANVLTELAVPLNRPGPKARRIFTGEKFARLARYSLGTAAVALLFGISLAISTWMIRDSESMNRGVYASSIGQVRTVVLQDGSTVQLNTNSLIEVDYSGSARRIRLLRGESHFQVISNPGKPFEVYANGNMVRAVGTAFSVYLIDNDVKVTVEEGSVELVTVGGKERDIGGRAQKPSMQVLTMLEHGQSTTFKNIIDNNIKDVVTLSEDELDSQFSWRRGILSFSGEPLSEVVNTINRYTPKTIEIIDPELKSLPVGGRFSVSDIEEIFEVLHTSFGIRVSRVGNQHILLRSE